MIETYTLNNMTFILHPNKTIIKTPLQTFLVAPARHNYSKKMERLRQNIREGKMTSMTEIVSYCNLTPGRRGQMHGIEMVNTLYERHEVKAPILN